MSTRTCVCLAHAYRTTLENRSFFDLKDECCPENNPVYPRGMELSLLISSPRVA